MNLTKYTLWGIVNHSKLKYRKCEYYLNSSGKCRYRNCNEECGKQGEMCLDFYEQYTSQLNNENDWTVEAFVVSVADEIAQRHHDIEDGVFGGLIQYDKLKEILDECFPDESKLIREIFDKKDRTTLFLRSISSFIVRKYVTEYIKHLTASLDNLKKEYCIDSESDFVKVKQEIYKKYLSGFNNCFGFDDKLIESDEKLSKYLKATILSSELAQTMDGKATFVIKRLFKAYLSNPQQLPDSSIIKIIKRCDKKDVSASDARDKMSIYLTNDNNKIRVILLRTICDYIAGMTDQFAMQQFNKLYGTNEMRNGL